MVNKRQLMIDHVGDVLVFVRVVESQNFTRAAEVLGLSRSAVGKSMQRLEARLGTRLVHRTTRQVSLSEEDEVFYQYALRILAEVAAAEAALSARNAEPSGLLRLAVPSTFGRLHVMPIVQAYLDEYPEVAVDVIFSDRYHDLVGEDIDMAIRIGGEDDSGLLRRVLAPHWLITCAAPAYLAKYGEPNSMEDVSTHQTITYLHSGRQVSWRFMQHQRVRQLEVNGRLRLDNVEAMLDAAVAGYGLIQAGASLVAKALRTGQLVPVLSSLSCPEAPVCAVYPSRQYLSPKVRCFIDAMVQAWQPSPPWSLPEATGLRQ